MNPAPTMNGLTTGVTVVWVGNNSRLFHAQRSVAARTVHRLALPGADCCGHSRRHDAHEHWFGNVEHPNRNRERQRFGRYRRSSVPGAGTLNGTAWLDANFNKVPDTGEPRLMGWTVALFLNGVQLQSVLTDANGVYRLSNVATTDGTSNRYELRFTAPGAGPNTAKLGIADSVFTNSLQRITDITVPSNSNLQNLNLPIAPNGVVYNSLTRTPIAGVTLNMLSAGSSSPLPAACFDDPAQQGQITQAGGYYRFDLNFTDPACSSGGSFVIKVTAPRGLRGR